MNTLFQKKGFTSNKFTLSRDKISIETRTLSGSSKHDVRLENLGLELQYFKKSTLKKKIIVSLCCIVFLITTISYIFTNKVTAQGLIFFYIILVTIAVAFSMENYQDDIFLVGGKTNLVFYRNIPNEQEVIAFIEDVKSATKKYLKDKYTAFDGATTSEEFYNCIRWLLDQEIISRQEYIDYKGSFDMQQLLN
jgi:hypothetical protein